MAKFPEPPALEVLTQIAAVFREIPAGTVMYRIFFSAGPHPCTWDTFRYFGPTTSRFDHHLPTSLGKPTLQARGIMYLACGGEAIPTCLAEVFQLARLIDRQAKSPVLAAFETTRTLQLLDLHSPFVTAVGASMAMHSGPKPRAQRWSQAFYAAYPDIDGLLYGSSMYANAPVIALYERAQPALPAKPLLHRQLSDIALYSVVLATAAKIGYQVV